MIGTSGMLERELKKHEDKFLYGIYTDTEGNQVELVIDSIRLLPEGGDGKRSRLCLLLRDGGQGLIKQ